MSDKNTLMAEIETVVADVQELLRKSGVALQKAEGEEEQAPPPAEEPAPEAAPAPAEGAPEGSDAIADQAAPAEGAPAPEGGEGLEGEAQESDADLATEAKGLSDEELDKLLEVLMAEKQGRGAGQQEQAPMEGPAEAAPAPEADPAQKSMKDDYAKLGKSIEALVGTVEAISKKVDSLSAKPAAAPKVTTKAPAANAQDVQVLHKSAPVAAAPKRLTKSETTDFLEGQLRKRNPLVDRNSMMDVVATKSEEELHAVQDKLIKQGIEFPKL